MPNLGTKYICYSCQTKFYDLGRAAAVCPKCGSDQKDADASPSLTSSRSRRIVEDFDDEAEFEEEPGKPPIEEDEEDLLIAPGVAPDVVADEEAEDDDDDEDEEY